MGNDSPYYEINGKRYDRITRILDFFEDPGLGKWKARVGPKEVKRVQKDALKVGSRVDHLIKSEILGKSAGPARGEYVEVHTCLEGWRKFREEHTEVRIIGVDRLVRDDANLVAGTLDIETEDSVIDVKCAGMIGPKYWLQVAMYNYMLPLRKPNIAILRLHKHLGFYEYQTKPYEQKYVQVFLGLLEAYRYYQSYGGVDDRDIDVADSKVGEDADLGDPEVPHDRPAGFRQI